MPKLKNGSLPSAIATLRQQMQWLNELSETEKGMTRNLVLLIIAEAYPEPIAQKEIEVHGLTPGPVSEALRYWEERGYVRPEVHPTDNRQKVWFLTKKKGERALRALWTIS